MLGKLELYKDKAGKWRWRFLRKMNGKWNLRAVGTDPQDSPAEAEQDAREIVVCCWNIDHITIWNDADKEEQFQAQEYRPGWFKRFCNWMESIL